MLDQKQQNIIGRISLFWSVELQGHPEQLNGGDHDQLIQTLVSTVQRGMLVQPDGDTCTPGHTVCIQFSAERAANVVKAANQSINQSFYCKKA